MLHQRRDVFAARPQRWQLEGKNIKAIVEVTTKFVLLYHLRQVAVGCSDQANVNPVCPGATQALELLFLQN